jgi:hypothetical protein
MLFTKKKKKKEDPRWGLLVLHGDQKEEIVFKWAVSGYLVKACKQSNSKKKILSNILA